MNQLDNQGNDGMSGAPDSQTNPFTQDLKGEFTSTFDTNANPVSQIFREGGFGGQDRTRNLALIAAVVVLFGGIIAFIIMSGEEDDTDFGGGIITDTDNVPIPDEVPETPIEDVTEASPPPATSDPVASPTDIVENATPVPEATPIEEVAEDTGEAVGEQSVGDPYAGGGVAATLIAPANGSSRDYDETSGSAEFTWDGSPGGYIYFSRSPTMQPLDRRARVSGTSYQYHHPAPGVWYWQVRNGGGSSEVRSFSINPPIKRNLIISAPTAGGALTGNGGVVAWQGDNKVAYYRVEISNAGWANPLYRFATSGTQLQVQGVAPGSYQLRVGGFSEASGRWEYSQPVDVTVQ